MRAGKLEPAGWLSKRRNIRINSYIAGRDNVPAFYTMKEKVQSPHARLIPWAIVLSSHSQSGQIKIREKRVRTS